MDMAPFGHVAAQVPQPLQSAELINDFLTTRETSSKSFVDSKISIAL